MTTNNPTATELGDKWCCEGCQKLAEAAVPTEPAPEPKVMPGHPTKVGAGYDCMCGECQALRSEPAPKPDSVPGWDRKAYDQLLHELRDQHLDGYADQVERVFGGLLAHHDLRGRMVKRARAEVDRLRAELEQADATLTELRPLSLDRQVAADALEWAAQKLGDPARLLRNLAAEIRAGTRTIPELQYQTGGIVTGPRAVLVGEIPPEAADG